MESRSGQMEANMRETGKMIKQMDMESSTTLMVTSTKDNGKMTKLMERVHTLMQMVLNILDTGKMTNSMVKVLRHGQMEPFMRDNIMKEKRMAKENLLLLMDQSMKETSK